MAITNKATYHKSVLVNEVIEYLNPQPNKTYVDATFGGGGHTKAILEKEKSCNVIAIDWDPIAIEKHESEFNQKYGDRFKLLWGNFSLLYKLLKKENIKHVDGILADFGTSQFQIHQKAGFSFRSDTKLDMRMSSAHSRIQASHVLNRTPEKELADIFFKYGEERNSRKIAKAIVETRKKTPFKTTRQLAELIETISPGWQSKKTHPSTKVFQALRIFVNKELENINALMSSCLPLLNPKGRMVFISFHSLEDRIVKMYFKENKDKLQILTPQPITATQEEMDLNPSSRSAKLRAAEKMSQETFNV